MTLSQAEIDLIKMHRSAVMMDAAPFWDLAREVCQQYGVKASDLSAPTRGAANVCAARDMVCYVAYSRGWSRPKIAKILRRDHSTIAMAIRKVAARTED